MGHILGCISHKKVETGDTMLEVYTLVYHLGKIRTHWHTKPAKIRTDWHTKKAETCEKDTHSSGTSLAFIYPKLPPPGVSTVICF